MFSTYENVDHMKLELQGQGTGMKYEFVQMGSKPGNKATRYWNRTSWKLTEIFDRMP